MALINKLKLQPNFPVVQYLLKHVVLVASFPGAEEGLGLATLLHGGEVRVSNPPPQRRG